MPQGESYEKLAGVVASMERLGRVFEGVVSSSKKLKEDIDKSDELFGTSNRLKDELQSALTSPVLFKKLNEVLSRNLGGTATPQIRQNLAKANAYRKQYQASIKAQQGIAARIALKQAALPHAATAQKRQAIQSQIQQLRNQYTTAGFNTLKQRAAMRAALARSKKSALGQGSKLGTLSKLGMLSKAAGYAGIALNVATEGIEFFDRKIRESGEIIAKYSQFSLGGAHAAQIMQVRDIYRNVSSARALSDAMITFARTNADMKDSWKNTNIVLDKLTLSLGTVGSKMGEGIGKILEPIATGFDEMMGGLKKGAWDARAKLFTFAAALGPAGLALAPFLEAIAKIAKWKTKDEEMTELKDIIKRRSEYFKTGEKKGLKPGDISPMEEAFRDISIKHPDKPKFPPPGGPMPAPMPPPILPGVPVPAPVPAPLPRPLPVPPIPVPPAPGPGPGAFKFPTPKAPGEPAEPVPLPIAFLEEMLRKLERDSPISPDPFDKGWGRPGKRGFPEGIV